MSGADRPPGAPARTIGTLRDARRREMEQTAFYRALAGAAVQRGDDALAERLHHLLADEQHHVSRLSARLLELGEDVGADRPAAPGTPGRDDWEAVARRREDAEIEWYVAALERVSDPATASVLEEILASERHHRRELSGKWMAALPGDAAPAEEGG